MSRELLSRELLLRELLQRELLSGDLMSRDHVSFCSTVQYTSFDGLAVFFNTTVMLGALSILSFWFRTPSSYLRPIWRGILSGNCFCTEISDKTTNKTSKVINLDLSKECIPHQINLYSNEYPSFAVCYLTLEDKIFT